MPTPATPARSTADTPRAYTPYNHYYPDSAVAFDWELQPVTPGCIPVVTLSVAHHKASKTIGVDIYTAVMPEDRHIRTVEFAWKSDKWAHRRIELAAIPVPRFNRNKLNEQAAFWLAEVQGNPQRFAAFFDTDDTAHHHSFARTAVAS